MGRVYRTRTYVRSATRSIIEVMPAGSESRSSRRFLVLYDEECPFCRASVRGLLRLAPAGAIEAVGLRSSRAARLVPEEGAEERLEAFHLIAPTGQRWKGGAALPPLFEMLRPLRPMAWLLRRSSAAAAAADISYGWVSRHRPILAALLPRAWTRPLPPARSLS
jgi:predicted DCC family thiol-disulfide oxidoreductase YuxK